MSNINPYLPSASGHHKVTRHEILSYFADDALKAVEFKLWITFEQWNDK